MDIAFAHLDASPLTPRLFIEVLEIQENSFGGMSKARAGRYLQEHPSNGKKVKYAQPFHFIQRAVELRKFAATYPDAADAKKNFLDRPLKSQQDMKSLGPYTSAVSK